MTLVVLRALVCVPDVALSCDTLDFGPVYTGCGKTMCFQVGGLSQLSWGHRSELMILESNVEKR